MTSTRSMFPVIGIGILLVLNQGVHPVRCFWGPLQPDRESEGASPPWQPLTRQPIKPRLQPNSESASNCYCDQHDNKRGCAHRNADQITRFRFLSAAAGGSWDKASESSRLMASRSALEFLSFSNASKRLIFS